MQRTLLRQYLSYIPNKVGSWLAREGKPYPKRGQTLRGTLVFADVSGFTAMSERLAAHGKEGAEILTQILNAYFTRMLDDLVLPAGGDLFKFGGDAMTLFFPAGSGPKGLARSARQAVHTALVMQEVMLEFAAYPTAYGEFNLKMSIGAHTGEVFGASLGQEEIAQEYVLAGAGVESCAQAETAAEATQVFVTEETLPYLGEVTTGNKRDGAVEILKLQNPPRKSSRKGKDLAEKAPNKKMADILAQARSYLPAGIPEKIEANPESPRIDSEHRDITVMFANFWGIDYNQRAQAYRKLFVFYNAMQEVVAGYGGVVNKMDMYVHGDKLMVLFGTPIAHADDPQRAVQCALDMIEKNDQLNLAIGLKIGINTGGVFSGNVGSLGRKEFTVMGDAVNLSARLMSAAGEQEIYVSPTTLPQLGQRFTTKTLEPIFVKGKAKPIPPSLILGRSQQVGGLNLKSPWGREKELVKARALLEQKQSVLISGEEGSGRSHSAHYLAQELQQKGFRAARGEGFAYSRNTPFAALAQLFSQVLLPEGKSNPDSSINTKLKSAGQETWAALVNPFLGLNLKQSPECASLEGDIRMQKTVEVLALLLRQEAKKKPLVLLVDNLQHLDEASRPVLSFLCKRLAETPVHWLFTTETKDQATWLEGISRISLPFFKTEQLKQFIGRQIQVERVPDKLLQTLDEKTKGNPAFTREILSQLEDQGLVKTRGDHRYVDLEVLRQAEALLPGSLHASQLAKVDHLGEAAKQYLRTAAIIGERFRQSVIYKVAESVLAKKISTSKQAAQQEAIQHGLLTEEKEAGEIWVRFASASLRESIYESAAFTFRRQTHLATGETLENLFGSEQPETLPALSYHYAQAGVSGKGFGFALRAGRWAQAQFANQEALGYFAQAESLAKEAKAEVRDLASIFLEQGKILALAGENEKAQKSLETTRNLKDAPKDLQEQALVELMQLFYRNGLFEEAELLFSQCQKKPLLSQIHQGRIFGYMGWIFQRQGKPKEAISLTEKAVELASRGTDKALEGYLTGGLGLLHLSGKNPPDAVPLFEAAIKACEEAHNTFYKTFWQNNLGYTQLRLGDMVAAKINLQEALKTRKQIGHWAGVWETLSNLGTLLLSDGNLTDAASKYEEALAICRDIGDRGGEGTLLINVGLVYGDQGQVGAAVGAFEGAFDLYSKANASNMIPLCSLNLADLLAGVFAPDQAEFHYEQGLTQSRELGDETYICEFLRGRGANAPMIHQSLPAREWLQESLEIATRHGNEESIFMAQVELASLPESADNLWADLAKVKTAEFSAFAQMTYALKFGQHLIKNGQGKKAQKSLLEAQRLAEKTGILRLKWPLEALLSQCSEKASEKKTWEKQAQQGALAMAETMDDDDLKNTFLAGARSRYLLDLT